MDQDDWDIYLPNIAFSYNVCPNRMTGFSPYQIIYANWVSLPIDHILGTNVAKSTEDALKEIEDKRKRDARHGGKEAKPFVMNRTHRDAIELLDQYHSVLQSEIKAARDHYDRNSKKYYDKKRTATPELSLGTVVYVDMSLAKVGNKKKLGINRKKGRITDRIGQNVYVIKYENGKFEPVNIERIYRVHTAEALELRRKKRKSKAARARKRQRERKESRKEASESKRKKRRGNDGSTYR